MPLWYAILVWLFTYFINNVGFELLILTVLQQSFVYGVLVTHALKKRYNSIIGINFVP